MRTGNEQSSIARYVMRATKKHHKIHVGEMVEGQCDISLDGSRILISYAGSDPYTEINAIESTLTAIGHTFKTTGIE